MRPSRHPFDELSNEEIAGRIIKESLSRKVEFDQERLSNTPGVGRFGLTRRVDFKTEPPRGDFEKPNWSDE